MRKIIFCDVCGADMRAADSLKAASAMYVDWQCTKCLNRKTVCEGLCEV